MFSFYIISSWSCWWYGTSYSSRAIIPAYLCLSIPLGYFLTFIFQSKIKFIVLPILLCCLALNVIQSWQTEKGILNGSLVSKAFYISIFLQTTTVTDEQRKLLLMDRYSSVEPKFNNDLASQFKLVLNKKLEMPATKETKDSILNSTTECYLTDSKNAFSPNISIPYNKISKKLYLWIKAKVDFYTTLNPDSVEAGLFVTMNHKDISYNFKYADIANKGYKIYIWNTLEFYFLTPDF